MENVFSFERMMGNPSCVLVVFVRLLLFSCGLCNGLPINLEISDSHTQLLTGLVAVLLTVCSVVLVAGCLCCQRRNGFKEFRDSPVVASTASNLDHGHVNPIANGGEFTIFTPLSPPHQNNNVFLANQQQITRTRDDFVYGDLDVSCWFDDKETDFPRTKLKYIKEIGKGWFGRVVEGTAQGIDGSGDQTWTSVVVRILEATASSKERVVFLHDASIYRCGDHPNVLRLIGRSLETIPLLVLQEYCLQGDLKRYLRENRPTSDHLLATEYPLVWCCQLTSALKHLHEHNVTHPDLAARNCQLTSNLTLKLGDYGLAVFHYAEDYYQGVVGVPVRWCAPESLDFTSTTIQPKKPTREANVWSLGVTIWEIFECGAQPYSPLTDDEVIAQVFGPKNLKLQRPTCRHLLYTDYIFGLMQMCWTQSESRPNAARIELMLGELLQVYKNTPAMSEFDKRWATFKPNTIVKTDNADESEDELKLQLAAKPLSPSLNNLHGSLDNLSTVSPMDVEAPFQHQLDFKLGPCQNDSLTDALLAHRNSSGSDTEDENWKNKIERGAYTEKVRQKSRSVADLMVLTHIDQSESENETPLPSIDFRANYYKNVRCGQNLENASLMFGSEGNLLSVEDTFKDELKKLQEEHKDSLLFVPDESSDIGQQHILMQELNNAAELQPHSQVFNVFNVTIDQFSPIHFNTTAKLSEFIHYKEECCKTQVQPELYDSGVEGDRVEIDELVQETEFPKQVFTVPRLVDLIQDNDALMDYIIEKYEHECGDKSSNFDSLEASLNGDDMAKSNNDSVEAMKIDFDLSENQAEAMPNSMTHSSIFTNGGSQRSLPEFHSSSPKDGGFTSLNYFHTESATAPAVNNSSTLYSLETWDNFLGKALDDQQDPRAQNDMFDSFTSEPPSLLFLDSHPADVTYVCEDEESAGESGKNLTFSVKDEEDESLRNDGIGWESNGSGWFLHPQSQSDDVTGTMTLVPEVKTDTYVGFGVDDEIMAAIRSELLDKLPKAQNASNSLVMDDEEYDPTERNEVFLRYNVYNAPLSPIPEETSFDEQSSNENTPPKGRGSFDLDDDLLDHFEPEQLNRDGDTMNQWQQHHRHTPSLDSCCSNDTLFNLEDLTCVIVHDSPESDDDKSTSVLPKLTQVDESQSLPLVGVETVVTKQSSGSEDIDEADTETLHFENVSRSTAAFLEQEQLRNSAELEARQRKESREENERHSEEEESKESHSEKMDLKESNSEEQSKESNNKQVQSKEGDSEEVQSKEGDSEEEQSKDSNSEEMHSKASNCAELQSKESSNSEEVQSKENSNSHEMPSKESTNSDETLAFLTPIQVAPLPSPEENPWKQLPASQLTKIPSEHVQNDINDTELKDEAEEESQQKGDTCYNEADPVTNLDDIYNEADYINMVNLENSKNTAGFNDRNSIEGDCATPEFSDDCYEDQDTLIINSTGGAGVEMERDIFGVLADIRFSGPSDSQLMTTSFSESNELNDDEQDWDSGSDTRSSSSGEFIWKEGEHEESLKALRAAPQDEADNVKPMDDILEETSSESSSGTDEDCESPEFVPSAWDKYATPTKSALRSPEKTMEKTETKKSKGVWFKKQKYHCVYEYPREPESPVLHSYDLWQPPQDFTSFGAMDDDFFISGSSKPFDMVDSGGGGLSSEFFPGSWLSAKHMENATPDSGVEDITPARDNPSEFLTSQSCQIQTLRNLASAVLTNNNNTNNIKGLRSEKPDEIHCLGGLRHTRDKLKLDLPPSPNSFTATKVFGLEASLEKQQQHQSLMSSREKPAFTTFGKSRFSVQHVDTPPDDEMSDFCKNVSFEALPYKPLLETTQIYVHNGVGGGCNAKDEAKGKIESVRGEASLLDSADEDSGIESSTLERKIITECLN